MKPTMSHSVLLGVACSLLLAAAGTLPARAGGCFDRLPARVPLGGTVFDLIATDADGDGAPVIAVATGTLTSMSWRGIEIVTSRPGGGMAVSARIATPTPLGGLVSGDFNNDGFEDVASAPGRGVSDAAVQVWFGDGHGGYSTGPRTHLPSVDGHSPVAEDFDRDGFVDVALIGRSGSVHLLLGDGTGHFALHAFEPRFRAMRLAAGDFDGDDVADLVLAGSPKREPGDPLPRPARGRMSGPPREIPADRRPKQWVSVWRGDGAAGFVELSRAEIPFGPQSVVAADLNDDRVSDLVVAAKGSPGAWNSGFGVLLGAGDGGFFEIVEYEATELPSSVALADVDGDGDLDILGSGATLGWLRGEGNGAFATWEAIDVAPGMLLAGDLDGDGSSDLVSAPLHAGALTILRGDGRGGWHTPPLGQPAGGSVRTATIGDFDRDGAPDVAALIEEQGRSRVVLLLNRGGTLLPPLPAFGPSGRPQDIAAGDFDGDGVVDLALADPAADRLTILHGDGVGALRAGPTLEAGRPTTIRAADVDGDGRDELIATLGRSSSTALLSADGEGGLVTLAEVTNGVRRSPAQLGDVDSDGHADLVVVSWDGRLRIAAGDGEGGFLEPTEIPLDAEPAAMILADVDADGSPDVVVAHGKGRSLTVFRSTAGGVRGRPQTLAVASSPDFLAAGDFDGDGRGDVAVIGWQDRSITFLEDEGTGLTIAGAVEAGAILSVIGVADFDGDGADDLAVTGPGPSDVRILGSCARVARTP